MFHDHVGDSMRGHWRSIDSVYNNPNLTDEQKNEILENLILIKQ